MFQSFKISFYINFIISYCKYIYKILLICSLIKGGKNNLLVNNIKVDIIYHEMERFNVKFVLIKNLLL